MYNSSGPYTAAWSESASTTTASGINVYLQGWYGGNIKGILRNGTTEAIIAQTNALNLDNEGSATLRKLTFATPPTITKGSSYHLSLIMDVEYGVYPYTVASSGQSIIWDTTGTYASPGADLTQAGSESSVEIFMQCVK